MRIGIDARLWNETGVGRYIRNLVLQLSVIDKKNTYVIFVKKGITYADLGIKNNSWKVVPTDIRWHTLAEQQKFPSILYKENLDLIHFPYFSIPIFYNKPYVITIHDLIINHFPTGKASTLPFPLYHIKHLGYTFIMKEAARKAKKIITVSQSTKDEIVDHLPVNKDKVVVTYEGVDAKLINTQKSSNTFLYSNDSYFLYVGNAYPHKNLDRLLDGFKIVLERFPKQKLLLVGEKNYFYKRLEEKVKILGLEKSVYFIGRANDSELVVLYMHAKAVVLPSLMEGFGLPGLEAMQSKCLVLASAIPSFKEIYKDAVIYFDPMDIYDISAKMQDVLDNPHEQTETIKKGIQVSMSYSWEKMARQTLKIYEDSISL